MKNINSFVAISIFFLAVFIILLTRNSALAIENDIPFDIDCPQQGCEILTPTVTPTPTEFNENEDEEGGALIEGNINIPCMFDSCPSPTVTPDPTATPTAIPTATPAPSNNQGGTGGSSSDGGSSSPSVQAATTLAATGTFMDTIMNIVALAGISSLGFGAFRYAKKNS